MAWIPVTKRKPRCPKGMGVGTPVLVWPQNEEVVGFCYYGRRLTGRPAFYIYGVRVRGVTHWMPLPEGPPNKKERSDRGDTRRT